MPQRIAFKAAIFQFFMFEVLITTAKVYFCVIIDEAILMITHNIPLFYGRPHYASRSDATSLALNTCVIKIVTFKGGHLM